MIAKRINRLDKLVPMDRVFVAGIDLQKAYEYLLKSGRVKETDGKVVVA